MAKPKFDAKDFLLRRGETLVMGVAGLFLFLLLVWGVSKGTSAMDPDKESKNLLSQADGVTKKIENGTPADADLDQLKMPASLEKNSKLVAAPATVFLGPGRFFDPTAQPNTKRENPLVVPIGNFQIDLIRGAMTGYDIIVPDGGDGKAYIAVLKKKTESNIDQGKLDAAAKLLKNKGDKSKSKTTTQTITTPPPGGNQPGGFPAAGGMYGQRPGMPAMGGRPGMGMFGGPHGLQGGGFDQQAQRDTTAIKYVPLDEIDTEVKNGSLPALTVIPLRMVTVNAVVPFKKQLDEIRKALRLPNPPPTARPEDIAKANEEVRKWWLGYDGFEVQRKVTQVLPNGTIHIWQDWPAKPQDAKDTSGNYDFEERYVNRIDTRKIADYFEEGYLSYFLKPEMMLAMPLPQLTKDLGVKYPDVKLAEILDNIERLKRANTPAPTQSDLAKQLAGTKPGRDIYGHKTADALEGLGFVGANKFGLLTTTSPGGNTPAKTEKPTAAEDVDNFLLRFIDSDVQPGLTYEYRIRLRMLNPNYKQEKLVAHPAYATEEYKVLYSKWIQLTTDNGATASITVPTESYLYAYDVKTYREQIAKAYPSEGKEMTAESKALNALLQVKDYQAVVQVATWKEQVKADENGAKREPVGAWVVAEMPVGRGEYIGRLQYVKLPLWSSEAQQYMLREVNSKFVKKELPQPKGWMVDFKTRSILVDFEGGRVKSKTNVKFDLQGNLVNQIRDIEESVGTEMLILRPDGKLVVRNSNADESDSNRKSITGEWARWVSEVENRKSAPAGGDMNPFDKK
jgi:hypothetical protein